MSITHRPPVGFVDSLAYYTVQLMRRSFDLFSGYSLGRRAGTLDERTVTVRCIFLETVAGEEDRSFISYIASNITITVAGEVRKTFFFCCLCVVIAFTSEL